MSLCQLFLGCLVSRLFDCQHANDNKFVEYVFLACRLRQASIVLERYFRFEISLLSVLCMLIARMEMGTSRVSGDSDIIT